MGCYPPVGLKVTKKKPTHNKKWNNYRRVILGSPRKSATKNMEEHLS
jgi:hypothetical protein